MTIAHYHLPGLFEFYELYCRFLPLYRNHPEYFYDWCDALRPVRYRAAVVGANGSAMAAAS